MATQQALLEGWDQPQDDVDVGENPSLRRSERESRPTEISMQYRGEMAKRSKVAFSRVYDGFELTLLSVRNCIKSECFEDELSRFQKQLEEECGNVVRAYEDLKSHDIDTELSNFSAKNRLSSSLHKRYGY